MPITLGSNIVSLRVQSALSKSTSALSSTFERLSSGIRINRASDDPAGLILASSIRSDSRVYQQALRNATDAASALNIADSAVDELSNIVARISEIAAQAANGTYTYSQRRAMDEEVQALKDEYDRITSTASFNGRQLLDGSFTNVNIQLGYGIEESYAISIGTLAMAVGDGTFSNHTPIGSPGALNNLVGPPEDLNGDGAIDLYFIDNIAGEIYVAINNGDGTFRAPVSYPGPGNGADVAAGDFNEDGKMDIAAAHSVGGLNIYFGNGDGTFLEPVAAPIFGSNIQDMSIVDINNDGHLDVGGSGFGFNQVVYLLGYGDGTFAPQQTFTVASNNAGAQYYDVNDDGNIDVVTTHSALGKYGIALGNGDGTFRAVETYAGVTTPGRDSIAGDFNNDGKIDLVFSTGNAGGALAIVLGNGDGTFNAPVSYWPGITSPNISRSAADLNGDGNLDLLGAGGLGPYFTQAMLGNGDGTFRLGVSEASPTRALDLNFADLDNDGITDVAMRYFTGGGVGYVMFGDGSEGVPGLSGVSVLTQGAARTAMATLEDIRDHLATVSGQIAAHQSRIAVSISNLSSRVIGLDAAYASITSADIADEVAKMTQLSILQQAATAILAQANQQPAIALSLLSGA